MVCGAEEKYPHLHKLPREISWHSRGRTQHRFHWRMRTRLFKHGPWLTQQMDSVPIQVSAVTPLWVPNVWVPHPLAQKRSRKCARWLESTRATEQRLAPSVRRKHPALDAMVFGARESWNLWFRTRTLLRSRRRTQHRFHWRMRTRLFKHGPWLTQQMDSVPIQVSAVTPLWVPNVWVPHPLAQKRSRKCARWLESTRATEQRLAPSVRRKHPALDAMVFGAKESWNLWFRTRTLLRSRRRTQHCFHWRMRTRLFKHGPWLTQQMDSAPIQVSAVTPLWVPNVWVPHPLAQKRSRKCARWLESTRATEQRLAPSVRRKHPALDAMVFGARESWNLRSLYTVANQLSKSGFATHCCPYIYIHLLYHGLQGANVSCFVTANLNASLWSCLKLLCVATPFAFWFGAWCACMTGIKTLIDFRYKEQDYQAAFVYLSHWWDWDIQFGDLIHTAFLWADYITTSQDDTCIIWKCDDR